VAGARSCLRLRDPGSRATIAARVVGLDPGLGVLHADQLNRDSLSTDLMEPVRPVVDRYLFDLLARRRFAAADFFETRQGVCRVTPPLARELAEAALDWGRVVSRVAEDVAWQLEARGNARPMPTPVSGRNRSAGRDRHSQPNRSERRPAPLAKSCRQCGAPVNASRVTCPGVCTDVDRSQRLATFANAGRQRAADLRGAGAAPDASQSLERMRIGERNSSLVAAARSWQATHQWPGPGTYERDVLPWLVSVSAAAIARRTGLSRGYCQLIKRGEAVPHPMWWETIGELRRSSPTD
jgi:CRISPR associated protein, Cas1 family